MANIFGEKLKELRLNRSLSIRQFCKKTALDPGNVSKWERGLLKPPQTTEVLERIAAILDLEPGSDTYKDFFASAAVSSGRIPRETVENEELLAKLPVLLRTIDGQKLTSGQLDSLIEIIKEEL